MPQEQTPPEQAPQSSKEDKNSKIFIWAALVLCLVILFGGLGYWFWTNSRVNESTSTNQPATADEDQNYEADSDSDEQTDEENDETDDDETINYTGWKTYTNTTGQNYQFMYPADADLRSIERCAQQPDADACLETILVLDGYEYPLGTLMVEAADKTSGSDNHMEVNLDSIRDFTWKDTPEEESISLTGASGTVISGIIEDSEDVDKYAAYAVLEGDDFYYHVYWWDEASQPNQETYENLLNSFIFSM